MNQEKLRERVRAGIDRHCAPLTADPYRVQRVLNAARQKGETKMKRKLSASFALAMALILLASAALAVAVVTIRDTGRYFARIEQELGDYIDWPAEKKAAVVCELMDGGYIEETAERSLLREGALPEAETARIADAAIAEFTGEDAKYASFLSVMSAAWGPFEAWPQEQKAWYSQVLAEAGAETEGKASYVAEAGGLTAEEAVAIAKKEIARGFGLDEAVVDKYRIYEVSLQIPEFTGTGNAKAYWYVAMDIVGTELEGQTGLPFTAIDVFVDPDTGMLLKPIEEKVAAYRAAAEQQNHPVAVAIRKFEAAINEPKAFHTWTLEHKARWSQEIAPQIKAYLEAEGDAASLVQSAEMRLSIACTYGLPDEKALPQEQAMAIARDALAAAYGLSEEEISLLMDNGLAYDEPAAFYDVTDAAKPLWRFVFTMPSIYCSDDAIAARVKALYGTDMEHNQFYIVEIGAFTGDVVRTFAAKTLNAALESCIP